MKKMYMLIGLPRSGKTTFRNQLIKQKTIDLTVVSADELRMLMFNKRFDVDNEPLVWYHRKIFLRSLMVHGKNVLIDETNTTIARRKGLFDLCEQYKYDCIGVHIATNRDICVSRALEDNDNDIIPIIDRMNNQFEKPNLIDEGFKMIYTVEGNDYTDLLNVINKKWGGK
jgi:predicted kinase